MDDLPDICRDDPTCYGLLQCVECYSVNEVGMLTESFNFLHLGIQEYLAAKYVASMAEEEVHTLLKETMFVSDTGYNADLDPKVHANNKSVRLANMWVLYFGVVWNHSQSISPVIKNFLSTYTDNSLHEIVLRATDAMDELSFNSDLYWSIIRESSERGVQKTSEVSTWSIQQQNSDHTNINISPAILTDAVNVLYLFQCFQEANDDSVCQDILNHFDDVIDLSNYWLLPHQVVSLGCFIHSHKKLKELDCRSCHIGDHGLSLLHHYLCGDTHENAGTITIAKVVFEHNDLTDASSSSIADIISHVHPSALWLGYNNCCFSREISDAITSTPSVNVISLHQCNITVKQMESLPNIMSIIQVLDLSCNDLGDDGAQLLSKGLANACTLKVLNVDNCGIKSTGVTSIAIAVSCNHTLQVLSLDKNTISPDAVVELTEFIRENSTLKELCLSLFVPFDSRSEFCLTILNSLSHNHTITWLRLPLPVIKELSQLLQVINDQFQLHDFLKAINEANQFLKAINDQSQLCDALKAFNKATQCLKAINESNLCDVLTAFNNAQSQLLKALNQCLEAIEDQTQLCDQTQLHQTQLRDVLKAIDMVNQYVEAINDVVIPFLKAINDRSQLHDLLKAINDGRQSHNKLEVECLEL